MKKTDFSKIADRYDKNKFRQNIEFDYDLKSFIDENDKDQYRVLDLACGTGLYLKEQIEYFKEENIKWYGVDASKAMLEKAMEKVENVEFINGVAEKLPYSEDSFDFISNNYAFHHFEEKEKALDEIARVLKKDGIFKMHNTSIDDMKNWWLYKFFPTAYYEDLKRYWDKGLIFNELSQRGFEVNLNIEYKMIEMKVSVLLDYVYNRDISVLTLISDEDYQEGLERMEYLIKNDSNYKIVGDFAEMFVVAKSSEQ